MDNPGHILPDTPSPSLARRALFALASLKLTLVIIIALLTGILIIYYSNTRYVWALAVPFTAFALNLAAAVATNPVFRRHTALLVFHLALISIALLITVERLTHFTGQVELTEGEVFSGQMLREESGPWHPRQQLDAVRLVNEGFTVGYAPDADGGRLRRGATRNQVAWTAPDGSSGRSVIGDQVPLLLGGYRFYATVNKGFTPVFSWRPADGGPEQIGGVHLPSYPRDRYNQANEWQPPGSQVRLWVMLQVDEEIVALDKPSELRVPAKHKLIVRAGDGRRELEPGDRMRLADGELTYVELRKWMGYDVTYKPTLAWLLAACVLAVLSMAWHFWQKFSAKPWNQQ